MVRILGRSRPGDPISAFLLHEDHLFIGTAMGNVAVWDVRSASPSNCSKISELAPWCTEGIRGLHVVEDRVHAVVGDHFVLGWKYDGDEQERDPSRMEFLRPHNPTSCATSYTVQSGPKIMLLTQGQGYSHIMDLESRRQQSLTTFGCPWHTIPCDLDGDRLLWREMKSGPDTLFSSGRIGDIVRLKVWDLQTPTSPSTLLTLSVKGHGGFRLWQDRLTCFRGSHLRLYSLTNGTEMAALNHGGPLISLDMLGDTLATASSKTIKLWHDGRCTSTIDIPWGLERSYSQDMSKIKLVNDKLLLLSTGSAVYAIDL